MRRYYRTKFSLDLYYIYSQRPGSRIIEFMDYRGEWIDSLADFDVEDLVEIPALRLLLIKPKVFGY